MKSKYEKIHEKLMLLFSPKIIKQVTKNRLSYLSPLALLDIYNVVRHLEKTGVKGIFIEAGCALGGSALVIAKAKNSKRSFYLYDAFEMIPSPSQNDGEDAHERYEVIKSGTAKGIKENLYYGYEQDLLSKVKETLMAFDVDITNEKIFFIKGLYQETMRIKDDIAFAHIDADWYESVMICLEEIEPHLVPGGVLIIDDYFDWIGCKKAVDKYFQDKMDDYQFVNRSRLHIIRK